MKKWLALLALCGMAAHQVLTKTEQTKLLAMGGSLDGNSYEESAPIALTDSLFESRHKVYDASTTAKLQHISIGGLCSTHSDCRSCLSDKRCSWCVQMTTSAPEALTKSQGTQACVARNTPCMDSETLSCSTSLVQKALPNICPVEEPKLSEAIKYWGYLFRSKNCQTLINECKMLLDGDCDPMSYTLRKRLPPNIVNNNGSHRTNVLCESSRLYNMLREAGRQNEAALVQDISTWKSSVLEAKICIVDVDHGEEYATEAQRGGCYVVAFSSDIKYTPSIDIPAAFVLRDVSPKEVVNLVDSMMQEPKVIAEYHKYIETSQAMAVLNYRRRVRRHLSNSVHVVTQISSKNDMRYFVSFVLVTLLQLHMASIEIMVCTDLEPALLERYKTIITHFKRYSITNRVLITPVQCTSDTTVISHRVKIPDGMGTPLYLAFFPNVSSVVLTREILSILATQLSLSTEEHLYIDGVLFTAFSSYDTDQFRGLRSAHSINSTLQQHSSQLYYKDRSPDLQLTVPYPDVERSLDALYSFMEARNYFCQHAFYNADPFQTELPKLLRCAA